MFKSLPTGQTLLQAFFLVIRLETGCAKLWSAAWGAEQKQVWKLRSPSGMLPPHTKMTPRGEAPPTAPRQPLGFEELQYSRIFFPLFHPERATGFQDPHGFAIQPGNNADQDVELAGCFLLSSKTRSQQLSSQDQSRFLKAVSRFTASISCDHAANAFSA